MIGNNANIGMILTNNKSGIVIASYADDAISRGQGFQIQKRITLTALQEYIVVLDSSALVAAGKGLFLSPLIMSTGGGMVFVDTYTQESYTGGNAVIPMRLNTQKATLAECVFKKGVTPSGVASDTREYIIGTLSTNQSSGGGSILIDVSKQFTPGSKIFAKFMNKENAETYVDFGLIFFEPQF